MIITKTPFRMSFSGGGSDMEEFYSRSEGAVLSVSLDKSIYISTHRFFEEGKFRIKYSRTETAEGTASVQHPIVREALERFGVKGSLEISSNGDVPSGTGLGSSSAFTVCLLHNLHVRAGRYVTQEELARQACEIEIERLKEPIGKQDQYAAAYGGLNVFRFLSNGEVAVEPLHLPKDVYKRFHSSLMLFYTGEQRKTSQILSEQRSNLKAQDKFSMLREMVGHVYQFRDALCAGNLDAAGTLLHKGWLLKRGLASKISTPELDSLYDTAIRNGALGGKLLGAGGGGFFLFYCPPERQEKLRSALPSLREFRFKFTNEGSKVIYVGDEY
ncbi:MAG: GHMP kinase [Elusimicrobia bacterium]|nr:GHMP kinase [Elusimicrobiota bacterium]